MAEDASRAEHEADSPVHAASGSAGGRSHADTLQQQQSAAASPSGCDAPRGVDAAQSTPATCGSGHGVVQRAPDRASDAGPQRSPCRPVTGAAVASPDSSSSTGESPSGFSPGQLARVDAAGAASDPAARSSAAGSTTPSAVPLRSTRVGTRLQTGKLQPVNYEKN